MDLGPLVETPPKHTLLAWWALGLPDDTEPHFSLKTMKEKEGKEKEEGWEGRQTGRQAGTSGA